MTNELSSQSESTPTTSAASSSSRPFLKALTITIGFLFLFFCVTLFTIGGIVANKMQIFLDSAQISFSEFRTILSEGIDKEPQQTDSKTQVLVLGLDSLETRPGSPALTDSMLLFSITPATGTIQSLAFPRDLWSEEYQTKINALYHYGIERYPNYPEKFPTDVLSDMAGVPIHYTLVISIEQLSTLIDLLGGIEIFVPHGFTDTAFPRPDVDVTQVTDPDELYQTVHFEAGQQTLSGERALQYIRSRKSSDETEGDDLARSKRQQLVIAGIAQKLSAKQTITNPELLGRLFAFYQEHFARYIPIQDLIGFARLLASHRKNFMLQTYELPVYPDDVNGIIATPPVTKYGVWVYERTHPETFRTFIQSSLGLATPATTSAKGNNETSK